MPATETISSPHLACANSWVAAQDIACKAIDTNHMHLVDLRQGCHKYYEPHLGPSPYMTAMACQVAWVSSHEDRLATAFLLSRCLAMLKTILYAMEYASTSRQKSFRDMLLGA